MIYGLVDKEQSGFIQDSLALMFAGVQQFPHEKNRQICNKGIGMGKLIRHFTPQSINDSQPVFIESVQVLFTFEGRIDNRSDIARIAGIKEYDYCSDEDLVLGAYLKIEKNICNLLRGDWSFAAYHVNTNRLFLARDHIGYTALFYYHCNNKFFFSNSQKAFFYLKDFKKEINAERLVRDLCLLPQKNLEQAYKNIFLLAPGHFLLLENNKITIEKYWFPENIQEFPFKQYENYAELIKFYLEQAVQRRLVSIKPVASMLSGGLDSSTVSVIAANFLKNEAKRLTTFSHVPLFKEELKKMNNSSRNLDETDFILDIVNKNGNINPILLNSENVSPLQGINKMLEVYDTPVHGALNCYWIYDITNTCKEYDFGTLLSGGFGNATISFAGFDYLLPLADRIKSGNGLYGVVKQIFKPFFLKNWGFEINSLNRKSFTYQFFISQSFLCSQIVREYKIREEINQERLHLDFFFSTKNSFLCNFLHAFGDTICKYNAAKKYYFGVDVRDPTADIDLIEQILALPNRAFFDDKLQNRGLIKRIGRDILPINVLNATKKGLQSADIQFRLIQHIDEIEEFISELSLNDNNIFDTYLLSNFFSTFKQNKEKDFLKLTNFSRYLMVKSFMET